MSEVVGREEGGELEAESLHVQPPVLLHILALHLAATSSSSYPTGAAAAACGVVAPVQRHGSSAAGLPPALHWCAEWSCALVSLSLSLSLSLKVKVEEEEGA